MNEQELLSRLRPILAMVKRLPLKEVETITLESSLADDLSMDSLDLIDLSLSTETCFGILIPMDDVKGIHTVGDWVKYITPLVNGK